MLSLNQILTQTPRVLVLDAASEVAQVGLLAVGHAPLWESSKEASGVGLFRSIEALRISIDDVQAFLFCDGPGSILGIRTAAVAIRTWQLDRAKPAYSYGSLAVAALGTGRDDLSYITDARRGQWNHYRRGGALTRVAADKLAGPLATPEGFKSWAALPDGTAKVPYSIKDVFAAHADVPLFKKTDAPDAFLYEEPTYLGWTPQIHRAPE